MVIEPSECCKAAISLILFAHPPIDCDLWIKPGLVWAFFWPKEMTVRTKVYVDGFNMYHAIDNLKNGNHLKWVNLWALSESLMGEGHSLVGVEYFSALKKTNIDKLKRHEEYI
jgi:hypothetical protein